MTKRTLTVLVPLIVIVSASLYVLFPKLIQTQPNVKFQRSELTGIQLFSTADSVLFQIPKADRTLLVFFNSDCHHCQTEFAEIEEAKDRFAGVEVVFFSIEPILQIRNFVNNYEFADQKNFHFTKINPSHQTEVFGFLTTPSFFFYKHNKLVSELKGKKSIDELLKRLR